MNISEFIAKLQVEQLLNGNLPVGLLDKCGGDSIEPLCANVREVYETPDEGYFSYSPGAGPLVRILGIY